MAWRLYIVPKVGTGARGDNFRPKYFGDGVLTGGESWAAVDYGPEGWMFVGSDLTPTDDATIVGEPDAFALPLDLNPTLTAGQVTNVQTKLEAANIPAGWVNSSLTWREVARTVLGVFSYLQRYDVIYRQVNGTAAPSLFTAGVTLDTTFGSLPPAVRTAMLSAATSFGFATAGLSGSTTLRVILKALADNFQHQAFTFNDQTI